MNFRYRGRNSDGGIVEGQVEAENQGQALESLKQNNSPQSHQTCFLSHIVQPKFIKAYSEVLTVRFVIWRPAAFSGRVMII